ncbi:RNA ligase, T4 RnlA [Balamuthia mandrillaris]
MEERESVAQQPELETVKYLRRHGLEKLVKEFSLGSTRHEEHPNLVQLRYQQLESPFSSPIVQECRGLILDELDNWRVVCYPFYKFFNYGESQAAAIDWSAPIRVQEKVDGSLFTLYFHAGRWHVASSSVPDARGAVFRDHGSRGERKAFRTLFWEIWEGSGYRLPEGRDEECCYMFELFSKENRIVVQPRMEALYLTGVRDLRTLQEVQPSVFAEKYGWLSPPCFEFKSLEEVVENAKLLDPGTTEGFVVCDQHFNRVKVKSPQYVAISLLSRTDAKGLNIRRMLTVVKHNEGSEFLSYFPQWAHLFAQIKEKYDCLCEEAEQDWKRATANSSQEADSAKAFGQVASKSPYRDFLFARRKGMRNTESAKAYFCSLPEKKLMAYFKGRFNDITDTKAKLGDASSASASSSAVDEEEREDEEHEC